MGKPNFSDEFKRDAVAQITERGYPVAEVSQRLGVSQHSLYAWKRQLARVTEERDILKNRPPRRSEPLVNRNSRRIHWMHAETEAACFLEA